MDGFAFTTALTVRFSETDAQAVAHHAAYLVGFEIARIDYLARIRYRTPARFPDRLAIGALAEAEG